MKQKSSALTFFLAVSLAAALGLCSCRSAEVFSAEQLAGALSQAGGMAVDDAMDEIKKGGMEDVPFIPQAVQQKLYEHPEIPGMSYLTGKWNQSSRQTASELLSSYGDYLKDMIYGLDYADPCSMMEDGRSVSRLLRASYYSVILARVEEDLRNSLDLGAYERIINQHNDYTMAISLLGKGEGETMESDPVPEIARALVELLFSKLGSAELHVRTTPDLNVDSGFMKVFGLDG